MAKHYTKAPDDVLELAARIIEQYHPDIKESGLTIDYIMVTNDTGAALTLRGRECAAIAKKISAFDRFKGLADCEIKIDDDKWQDLDERERSSLLDHELYHFKVERGDDGEFKKDSEGRPVVTIRPHDVEVGWFTVIAERWKEASYEVKQAKKIFDDYGQALFPFLHEDHQPLLPGAIEPPAVPGEAAPKKRSGKKAA